jgi:urea transporter
MLLEGLLAEETPPASRLGRWLPSSGTLPGVSRALGGNRPARAAEVLLRSLGQVIFLNNPLTGLLLLLALLLHSPAQAALTLAGIATANATALALDGERGTVLDGIYGFNGALVGSLVGAFPPLQVPGPVLTHWALGIVGAALSSLLVRHLGGWMKTRLGLPVLTLPFCLVGWCLVGGLAASGVPLPDGPGAAGPGGALAALLLALPGGFAQVFLCSGVGSGVLIALAVVAASPITCGLGLLGAACGAVVALLLGVGTEAVGMGLWSYDALLTAIAVGGIFHAPTPRSLPPALGAAGLAAAVNVLLASWLPAGLPLLTFPFVLTTLVTLTLLRRWLPSMVPVALHAVVMPEEHLRRFRITRGLLAGFHRRLRRSASGALQERLANTADGRLLERIAILFRQLDHDRSGCLAVNELAAGLLERGTGPLGAIANRSRFRQLARVLRAMDLDGDGRVDLGEFTELILRLRLLVHGRERLRHYVLPIDGDGDGLLQPHELDRLLCSVGLPPLAGSERRQVFAGTPEGVAWDDFLDRLLLT